MRYHHAITYFEYAIPEDDDQQDELDSARLPVYSNFAACMLKLGRLDEALKYCQQSLRIDAHNVKVLYRKAQVYRMKEKFDEARATIQEALSVVSSEGRRARLGGDAIGSGGFNHSDDYGSSGDSSKGEDGGDIVDSYGAERTNRQQEAGEDMRAQQLLTLRVELGRIRQGIASYKRNSQRMGRAMFAGIADVTKRGIGTYRCG